MSLIQHRNVGLFRYWTLSNVPLFVLAIPMFTLLTISGWWALNFTPDQLIPNLDNKKRVQKPIGEPQTTSY